MSYSRTLKLSIFFFIQFFLLFITTYINFFDLQIWNYYVDNTFYNTYLLILVTSLLFGFMTFGYAIWSFLTCCWNERPFENLFKFSWLSLLITILYYVSIGYSGFLSLLNEIVTEPPFDIMYQIITWGGIGNIGLITLWTSIERFITCWYREENNYQNMDD